MILLISFLSFSPPSFLSCLIFSFRDKLPLDITISDTIQLIIARFKVPPGEYELLNGDVVLAADSILGDNGVAARSVLEFRAYKPPAATGFALPLTQWDSQTVLSWIKCIDLGPAESEALKQFEENMVTGKDLAEITDAELKEDLGIKALGARKKIVRELSRVLETGYFNPEISSQNATPTPAAQPPVAAQPPPPIAAQPPPPIAAPPPPSAATLSAQPPPPTYAAVPGKLPPGGIRAQLEGLSPRLPMPPSSASPRLAVVPPYAPTDSNAAPAPAGPVAQMISTTKGRTVSRSQLATLATAPSASRPRTPSFVSAAANVASQNASAGANFGPSSQRSVQDVVGAAVGPAPYLDEIRVAGTILAEMRAAVESSQQRQVAAAPAAASAPPSAATKSKTQSTFGIGKVFSSARPTSQVVALASTPAASIPLNIALINTVLSAIQKAAGLSQEGIFRISGGSSAVRLVYEMMRDSYQPDLTGSDPHDIATAFKMYLRELSSPLIPYPCYSNLISAVIAPGKIDGEALSQALSLIPPENKAVLRLLISFLQLVVANQAVTKMNPKNLAIVFGPTLLRSEDPMSGLREAAQQTDIIQELIEKYPSYFDASTFEQLSRAIGEIGSSLPALPSSSSTTSAASPLGRSDSRGAPPKRGMFGRK